MPSERIWKVSDVIKWTSDFFLKKKIENPRVTSELLLAEVMETDRTHIYIKWNEVLDNYTLGKYREYINRVVQGEPVSYVLGHHRFMKWEFKVDSSVLIPRFETEELVEMVVSDLKDKKGVLLDLCTGSGVIGITLGKYLKNFSIMASDISEKAVEIARINASNMEMNDKITFFTGDFLSPLADRMEEIDYIVCNPPYVGKTEVDLMGKSTLEYEPHIALFAGDDGLDFYRKFVDSKDMLKGKVIYLEYGFSQKEALENLFKDHFKMSFHKDVYGHWRFVKLEI